MKTGKTLLLLAVISMVTWSFVSFLEKQVVEINTSQNIVPVLKRNTDNPVLKIQINASKKQVLKKLVITTEGTTSLSDIKAVRIFYSGEEEKFSAENQFGESMKAEETVEFTGSMELGEGIHFFWVSYELGENANIDNYVDAELKSATIKKKEVSPSNGPNDIRLRTGIALRKHMDENVHTYRIPGLATTNNGTLIAVYDIRRNGSVDLQEDVDVGMNRSTDGGRTWEPMKVIMDMGEWGGKPQNENGIGDPSVLVDRETNTIWVAAIWAHGHPGERNWNASKPGMKPELTSQFVLVKSEDDGITWSDPINITEQIKEPEWQLLLQGPGKGITLEDGTIVFPAQYKDKDRVPHSTLIYSKDRGETWNIGTGVRYETTEAQVVQLQDGSIMINARNNEARNNEGVGRVVAITNDLGATWTEHSSSVHALEEPTCMASLIYESFGSKGPVMLFSNPNEFTGRFNMTVKVSKDEGTTWPEKGWTLLDEGRGRGYSCMTRIDDETIGILYEGSQADLIFQRLKVGDLVKE
jgi:sialidase-1